MKRFTQWILVLALLLSAPQFVLAADVSVTAANVASGSGAVIVRGTAGATITAGQVVYLDSSDNEYKLADNDDTAAKAAAAGIALHGASDGQPLAVQTAGNINVGATLTVGEIYVVSSTAGGIAPEADNGTTNDYVTVLGVATSASNLKMVRIVSGAQIP